MRQRALLSVIIVAATLTMSPAFQQQPAAAALKAQDEPREGYQRASDVLKALDLSRGDLAADVGAGNGYYSQRMAEIVGPAGKVFAEDIAGYSIKLLHERVDLFHLRNVEIVKGTPEDPQLPAGALSAVLVVNAYHHFAQPEPMLKHIREALNPGGRLVIADYSLPDHRTQPRAEQLAIHEIDPALVRAEVTQAGFRIVRCDDPFLKRMPDVTSGDRIGAADMWLMVAMRPR